MVRDIAVVMGIYKPRSGCDCEARNFSLIWEAAVCGSRQGEITLSAKRSAPKAQSCRVGLQCRGT